MRYWWVNQNQTHKFEVPGGFLWSPKTNSAGNRNYFYDAMTMVMPGDVVFSYYGTKIQAIGIVQKKAITAPKPDFENAGVYWSNIGWYVEVEFGLIANPFRPKDFIDQIRPFLPTKYSPLSQNGDGLQIVYLTEVSYELGTLLIQISNANFSLIQHELAPIVDALEEEDIQREIESKHLEGDLEKIQLTKSRRGQGTFKANVRLVESRCRVTGVSNIKHLRASHIKPWSKSSNHEKLDGNNGLLLSPHVDHLFNDGYISFENSGKLIVSQELNPLVLEKWSISNQTQVGKFNSKQCQYLEYHRDVELIR